MDETRALLDELMGKDRNAVNKGTRPTHFSDPEICKYYSCGFCPNELFINTKSDLGACKKKHDDSCREQFMNATPKEKYPFEREFIRHLDRLIDDLDRRIKKGHERIELDGPTQPVMNDKIRELTDRIQGLLQKVEELAENGKIEESQRLIKVVDQLKAEKELAINVRLPLHLSDLMKHEINSVSAAEKRMKVCEICGAFLVLGDTEKRVASHIDGKQHQGYALIRKTLEEYRARTRLLTLLKKKNKEEGERSPTERDRGRDSRDNRDNRDRHRDDRDYDHRRRDNRDNRDSRDRGHRRRERDGSDDEHDSRKRHK